MGHSVWADIVPYVAHNLLVCDFYAILDDVDSLLLFNPEDYVEGEWTNSDEEYENRPVKTYKDLQGLVHNGWTLDIEDDRNLGKKEMLWGFCWHKDDLTVWTVNESHYSNAGDIDMCVVADDEASVKAFLADWNLTAKVVTNDVVYQSG